MFFPYNTFDSQNTKETRALIMKQVLSILLATSLLLSGCSTSSSTAPETTAETTTEQTTLAETTAEVTTVEETTIEETTVPETTVEKTVEASTTTETTAPADPKDEIVSEVESSVRSSLSRVDATISDISVNENLGTDNEDDYIALIYLSFDAKNTPRTSKDMINLITNEVAYNLVKVNNISEITIFWTVPYLSSSNNNIAKANLLRNKSGFYFADEWYDPAIF